MYILASLYTQYLVKCPKQDCQVDWPMANGTILLKITHSFNHSRLWVCRLYIKIHQMTAAVCPNQGSSDINSSRYRSFENCKSTLVSSSCAVDLA